MSNNTGCKLYLAIDYRNLLTNLQNLEWKAKLQILLNYFRLHFSSCSQVHTYTYRKDLTTWGHNSLTQKKSQKTPLTKTSNTPQLQRNIAQVGNWNSLHWTATLANRLTPLELSPFFHKTYLCIIYICV